MWLRAGRCERCVEGGREGQMGDHSISLTGNTLIA